MSDFSQFVVHCKREPFDVYVGRPGPWGNPFSCKEGSKAKVICDTAEESVACFEAWVLEQPELIAKIKRELKGKKLGCWCGKGKPCHGLILARIANEE